MSSQTNLPVYGEPLDLSRWRALPIWLMVAGVIGIGVGFLVEANALTQFAFSWLVAFMFFLSLGLGGLGFTILHHLFDAGWSVPIRRAMEQLGCILRWAWLLWLPIGFLSPRLYEWVRKTQEGHLDHATLSKHPWFTLPGFWITAAVCLGMWWFLPTVLRSWSLKQDETGSAECTRKMRFYSAWGVFAFGFSLTAGALQWVKGLEHDWYSTMYGVWYFAGTMWTTIATVYLITMLLERQGALRGLVHEKTYYFIGSILFAFTVFYAYITFAQYFIYWNANVPEETFWFVKREVGADGIRTTWFWVSMVIIFGHFFVPFLSLLRIDVKLKFWVMVPLIVWAWLMHYNDLVFNIMPVLHPKGIHVNLMDLGCMAFVIGFGLKLFISNLNSAPIVPQRDPRFAESQDIYVPDSQTDEYVEAATARGIDHKNGGRH